MRWLLLLFQWSLLFSLLEATDCNWEMPKSLPRAAGDPIPGTVTTCTQAIKWKAHDDKEALATCLEYFPTTYVTATFLGDTITCTVSQHFQCNFLNEDLNAVPMFDKCYTFHPVDGEKTMQEYLDDSNKPARAFCQKAEFGEDTDTGSLPVFYTMTQAKHIAKAAHRSGISKFWVNADKDGKTIEKAGTSAPGFLLYKDQWKLHKDHYWEGDELKATTKTDNVPNFPDEAKYLFFRSKTDYWRNLIQGSFERATSTSKAGIVCEYQAKVVPEQESYCLKMGEKGLGLNAKYDTTKGKRCIYTTLSRYPLMGTADAITNFKGCGEKPSDENSAGMDDGTASASTYATLTADGTYRVAAIKAPEANNANIKEEKLRKNCNPKFPHYQEQRDPFEIYDHSGKKDFAVKMMGGQRIWEDNYPKDECTDFPKKQEMFSNTLAIKNGKIIDVPTPVLFPVICSIASNVDCEVKKGHAKCKKDGRKDLFCKNVMEWQPNTKLYATCECPRFHAPELTYCRYTGDGGSNSCGMAHDIVSGSEAYSTTGHNDYHSGYADRIDKVWVRNGCTDTFYANDASYGTGSRNPIIAGPFEVGEHEIPNGRAGTLRGWNGDMAPSSHYCVCTDPK